VLQWRVGCKCIIKSDSRMLYSALYNHSCCKGSVKYQYTQTKRMKLCLLFWNVFQSHSC